MRYTTGFAVTAITVSALLGFSAQAQTPAPSTPAPVTNPPAATAPVAPPASGLTARPITPPTHHRMTIAQRFAAANVTHDGHLTLEQAKAANFTTVIRNYDQIDTAKKGYVTIDEIHAYNRTRHRVRRGHATPTLEAQ